MPNKKRAERTKQRFLDAYESYGDDVFAFMLTRTNSRDVALDLTQDIFANVWKYLSRGKRVHNLKAFIFRTARNRLTDYYRKKKAISLDMFIEGGWDLSDNGLAMAYARERIDADYSLRSLSALSPHHYEVIQMRFEKDMSIDEMAFVLGINKNAVSVRLHRAISFARKHLQLDSDNNEQSSEQR